MRRSHDLEHTIARHLEDCVRQEKYLCASVITIDVKTGNTNSESKIILRTCQVEVFIEAGDSSVSDIAAIQKCNDCLGEVSHLSHLDGLVNPP